MRKVLSILIILLGWNLGFSQCQVSIVPNKASYCGGEAVTIRVQNVQVGSTYRIQVGSQTVNDTFGVFVMPGGGTTRDYDVVVNQTKNGVTLPCNFPYPKLHVLASPDPSISERNNFKYCTGTNQNVDAQFTNTSSTTGTNTSYQINWGDGSAVFNSPTFSTTLTHNYPPGRYVINYTVTGSGTPPCNTVTRDFVIIIGQSPRIDATFSQGIICAPTKYTFNLNLDSMKTNFASTRYSLLVNNQVVSTYTQTNLPATLSADFQLGSCQSKCNGFNKYSVIFRATNECGTTDASTCVPVKDSVVARIEGKDTVCINQNTTYINSELGKIYQDQGNCQNAPVTWDISPGTGFNVTNGVPYNNGVQTIKDFQVTFTQYGTYFLTMKVFGDCNTDDTVFKITVVDPVKAGATFTQPSCIPPIGYVDIPFTNTSTGTIQTYSWTVSPTTGTSFIVGNATTKDVTIRFTRSGSYTVSMAVTGSCNTDTWNGNVLIKGKPNIDTTKIPPGCSAPYTFNPSTYFIFDNGGDNNATYAWSLPGGNPASSTQRDPGNVTYAGAGFYTITLKVSNICGDSTLAQPFTVFNNIKPDAGSDQTLCKSANPVTLVANPAGGVWHGRGIIDSIRGIFDPSRVPSGTEQIIYILNPNAGCPTYDTINIRIVEIIGLTAGPDQSICKSSGTLSLVNDPAFPNGNWIGIGVTSSIPGIFDPKGLVPGNYQVGYIFSDTTGACLDTAYKRITVFDSVHVTVPAPILCAGQSFDFGSITGNLSSATWKFGDGTPDAIIVNPSHIFANPGHYIVTLIAETPDRCKDTIKIPVDVIKNPPLSFIVTPDSSCTGNNILFSFPAGHDTATNYFWDFGLSTVQSNQPVSQTYSFPKPILNDTLYLVTLRADYFCGPSYFTDTVKVKANPKADFGVQPTGCSPFTPTLASTSYGSPTSFFWNFGNGQTTTLQNPAAPTYTNMTRRDSVYTISLKVSNACGSDSIKKNITVKANDVFAKFFTGINQGCQPIDVDFYNISSPGAQIIWDFGDGTTSYADNVVHTYDTAGIFRVKLLALGSCGRDSAFGTVTVYATPKVDFDVINPCAGHATQFINKTTNGNSNTWYFGDGTQSTTPNPIHTYAAVGVYRVKLIVANSRPCVDSIEKDIGVFQQPTSSFTVTNPDVCQQEPTIFNNNSVNANTYLWYLGNGETSTDGALVYTYPNSGNYNVSLVAINGQCRDSSYKIAAVQIYPKPLADFIYDIASNGFHSPVEFTNITLNGVSYFWTFGDGDTSVEKDPTHQYLGEGPYRVTLYAVSSHDCKDTVTKALGVDYDGTLYVPNVLAPEIGNGESAIFKPKGLSLKEYHLEIFSTYGQLLWETDKLENGQPVEGWDGRFKGTIMPQDVYVWKIRAIFITGKAWEGMKDPKSGKKATMGSVILLR
ncbi:MAG: hypothetical protein JWN78_2805 [Bacteroidota bacterium]|nr:hypothetical protein [Bacteroidota bacterium]